MGIRKILLVDDPSLKKRSREVTNFNKRLHVLLDDMHETLKDASGLGLAAPQVGILRRVVLIVDFQEGSDCTEERVIELINPEVLEESGQNIGREGCLSIPGVYGMIERPETVRVKAQDRHGTTFELTCKDITARAIRHEIDHLDGLVLTSLTDKLFMNEDMQVAEGATGTTEATGATEGSES